MDYKKIALEKHAEWKGKLSVETKAKITNKEELSIAYTPGVAAPCLEIEKDEELAYKYTGKGNTVAVITDGTAVLGLGDIGPVAGMPVMEGKCALFKAFANIDAVPICIDTKDTEEIIKIVYNIHKSFGGINLEDISAPRCFEIEKRLIEMCDIPVFHDDQHGTAIITTAGIINALKVTGRKAGDLKIVFSGAGAAGISIAKMFIRFGFGDIILCDKNGAIYEGAEFNNEAQEKMAKITNKNKLKGKLEDVIKGADILVGVSKGGIVTKEMIKSMAKNPIVFAMANPVPEIMPDLAKEAGAAVVGTGRSDFPNQVNNVLAFPGIFRGALDCRATKITEEMKDAAAIGLASIISDEELSAEYILPDGFNPLVVEKVAAAVKDAWAKQNKK
ncbi:MAG: NAD-dependent malic enzyme [Fusobacterium sp.]|nr:NAD-dependent malic enzyme [Fusobacterium sp.]